jgi:hypothetical protein
VWICSLIRNLTQTKILIWIPKTVHQVMRTRTVMSMSIGMTRMGMMLGPENENPLVSQARRVGNEGG